MRLPGHKDHSYKTSLTVSLKYSNRNKTSLDDSAYIFAVLPTMDPVLSRHILTPYQISHHICPALHSAKLLHLLANHIVLTTEYVINGIAHLKLLEDRAEAVGALARLDAKWAEGSTHP